MDTEPIISKRISGGTRVYYFDGYRFKDGDIFLVISEIPTANSPQQKRHKVLIHQSNFASFAKAFAEITDKLKNGIER